MRRLSKVSLSLATAALLAAWPYNAAISAEHGGKAHAQEHGGKEHGGAKVQKAPAADDIRGTMRAYVEEASSDTGTFDVLDETTGQVLNLELVRVHERVGKTGDYYYSCADFVDANTGEEYDLDLDVADQGGGDLVVADVRVHKEGGVERYTYDNNDNRIPVAPPTPPADEQGGKEHGGKEHGGT